MRVRGPRRAFRYDVTRVYSYRPSSEPRRFTSVCESVECTSSSKQPAPNRPKHYTLIDLATHTRAVATSILSSTPPKCEISDVGVERLVRLILATALADTQSEVVQDVRRGS